MGSVGHRWIVLAAALLAASCAQGGVGRLGDGGASDGGRGRRDGGGSSSCDPEGSAASCQDATDLGVVAVGGRVESMVGLVDRAGAAQWVKVQFPLVSAVPDGGVVPDGGTPTMEGGGEPRIRLLRNDGDVYRVEIRSECTSVASCGEGGATGTGMATNLTEWSFTDDPALSEEGAGRFSSRDVPWPATVYVRIYATADPDCGRYQLEITR
jgi:hypothetical protein